MNKDQEYLDLCYELGFTTLDNVTLKWNRNGLTGNYITVEVNGEEDRIITDPIRMNKISMLTRSIYRSKEEKALEESLWQS